MSRLLRVADGLPAEASVRRAGHGDCLGRHSLAVVKTSGQSTPDAGLGLAHLVDRTARNPRLASLDVPVDNHDNLIVDCQVILPLLDGIQRVASILDLFNATAINIVTDWIRPSSGGGG